MPPTHIPILRHNPATLEPMSTPSREFLPAQTVTLVVPLGTLHEVYLVPLTRAHRLPVYRVAYTSGQTGKTILVRPQALYRALLHQPEGVIAKVPKGRPQMIWQDVRGIRHIPTVTSSGVGWLTECGAPNEYQYVQGSMEEPTCQACLDALPEEVWVRVWPECHLDRKKRRKAEHKAKKAKRAWEARPSVFDRVLDDALVTPRLPVPVVREDTSEQEDATEEHEQTVREAKLRSAREKGRREKGRLARRSHRPDEKNQHAGRGASLA